MPSTSNTRELSLTDKDGDLCSGWWLEIGATNPLCINFYGPFESQAEAEVARRKSDEGSKNIYSCSRLCQPRKRTIKENELTMQDLQGCPPTFFEALLDGPRIY